jgi:hypothetical protein
MKASNLWEKDRLAKLTTLEAVDREIERCEFGLRNAPSTAKVKEWGRKLIWLGALRRELERRSE